MNLKDSLPALNIGYRHDDLAVKTPGSHKGRI
jgi:hypothetical protein